MSSLSVVGANNKIILIENGVEANYRQLPGLSIFIKGNRNKAVIELPSNFENTQIVMVGNDNYFSIKSTETMVVKETLFYTHHGSTIDIGKRFSVPGSLSVHARDGKKVLIGEECMCAKGVAIRNNDGHVIVDTKTNEIINYPEDVIIGNHVWIAAGSSVLKGVEIADGSVVGTMSLVNKKFKKKNIVIAGNPAKKVRENVAWHHNCHTDYIKQHNIET